MSETPRSSKAKRARNEYRAGKDEPSEISLPKKKFYRQRAHTNPFSDHALS
jgi:tRNA (guanine-N7-)-methyltransferase